MTRIPKTVLLRLLRGYKWVLSPMLPPACRYVPTCSEYAAEAIERYGAFRGSAMAIWRVFGCQPFLGGGVDAGAGGEIGKHPDGNGGARPTADGGGGPPPNPSNPKSPQ